MKYLNVDKATSMMGSRESALRVLKVANGSLQGECDRFRQAIKEQDISTCFKILHSLKGSVQIFGTDHMVDLVVNTESRKAESLTPVLISDLSDFSTDLQNMIDEIKVSL